MSNPTLVARLQAADLFGALHIVVEDGNIDDGSLHFCFNLSEATSDEKQLAEDLLKLTQDDREALFRQAGMNPAWWDHDDVR